MNEVSGACLKNGGTLMATVLTSSFAEKNSLSLALQDNDTKVRDRVIYIYSTSGLYTNITG